jgi:hypothetical protein
LAKTVPVDLNGRANPSQRGVFIEGFGAAGRPQSINRDDVSD